MFGHMLCSPVRKAPQVESVEYRLSSPPFGNPTGYAISVFINYRSTDNERESEPEGQEEQEKVSAIKGKFGHKDPYGATHEVFYVAGEGDFDRHEEAFLDTTALPLTPSRLPPRPPPPPPPRPPPLPPRRAPTTDNKIKSSEKTTTTTLPPMKHSPPIEQSLNPSCIGTLCGIGR